MGPSGFLPPADQLVGTTTPSSVICKWDGAINHASHSAGGVVVMNPAGEVLRAKGVQFVGVDEPLVAEMLTLHEAVLWCIASGFTEVQFEGDDKVIIDKFNHADIRDSRIGALLEEVLHCLSNHSGFSVRFVGRRSNRVAHLVARKTLLLYPTTSRVFDFLAWLNSRM
ncbi:unnamed protein product [Linum trigynum]|uniref:RNase H type-1 domain-containing protein n=1 Tax=Linum trigynum TaxID=586398 RepID=A0AAV2DU51_9ROSI